MHMRKKKWALPELTECGFFTREPETLCGHWRQSFEKEQPLHVELGCGKGVSTAVMAHENPDVNYAAFDISADVLGNARRNVAAAYGDAPVRNLMLVKFDISYIYKAFSGEDRVERIYISFCNPWAERLKHHKRRLTHPRQLMQYRTFLVDGGEIWFKTDDDALFNDSLKYFEVCGFECRYLTRDLHQSGFAPNYLTEHEMKYTAEGVPIKFGIFVKKPGEIDLDPTRFTLKEEEEE